MDQTPKNENLLTIEELSEYLNIKRKTLYSKLESGEIPHYKIGRLVRFRMGEVDAWLERSRKTDKGIPGRVRRTIRATRNIDRLVQKAIDESKRKEYTPNHEKSDQIKGLGKEV
ncbi:MAG: helix-turn-helix domain-containing protein [Syntrophales bacterium]|jgi:excisionase family DNA binding protein|nr:helix-turn-helix domain-containing protein [Syntrophales bacterium]